MDESSYPADSLDATPEMALHEGLRDLKRYAVESEEGPPSKALVIFLWDDGGDYSTRFINAGLKLSEIISLTEVTKLRTMELMDSEETDAD